jgi:hypothetical protein
MVRAEKITPGPVGKGTRFRSAVASRGRTAEMLIECTGYDRCPAFRWHSQGQNRLRLEPVEACAGACNLKADRAGLLLARRPLGCPLLAA